MINLCPIQYTVKRQSQSLTTKSHSKNRLRTCFDNPQKIRMCPETKIVVFTLSEADEFKDGVGYAVNWLRNKGEKPYYFRENKPKNLPSGSIVLFSFKAQIFGQAVVKEDIKEVPLEERRRLKAEYGFDYKHSMILEPEVIIFHRYPTKKEVSDKLGIIWGRLFKYLNWQQYQQILEMAESKTIHR